MRELLTTVSSSFNIQRVNNLSMLYEVEKKFFTSFSQKNIPFEFHCKLRMVYQDKNVSGSQVLTSTENSMEPSLIPCTLRALFIGMERSEEFFEFFKLQKIMIPVISDASSCWPVKCPILVPREDDPNQWNLKLVNITGNYRDFYYPVLAAIEKKPLR